MVKLSWAARMTTERFARRRYSGRKSVRTYFGVILVGHHVNLGVDIEPFDGSALIGDTFVANCAVKPPLTIAGLFFRSVM